MSETYKLHSVSNLDMAKVARTTLILAAGIFLAACAANLGPVRISQDFPTPLVVPLDYKVGIYYSPEFRKYRHVDANDAIEFELGSKQTNLFSKVFSALFTHVERVEDPTSESTATENFDLILMPVMEEYAYLTPRDTANQFYAVSIKYHIRVFDADKTLIGYWPFIAYGKNRGGLRASDSPLGDATDTALRDAAAALVTQFREVVLRKEWQQMTPQQQESPK